MKDAEIKVWREEHFDDPCCCSHHRGRHYSITGSQGQCNQRKCRCRSFALKP